MRTEYHFGPFADRIIGQNRNREGSTPLPCPGIPEFCRSLLRSGRGGRVFESLHSDQREILNSQGFRTFPNISMSGT